MNNNDMVNLTYFKYLVSVIKVIGGETDQDVYCQELGKYVPHLISLGAFSDRSER